MFFFGVLGFLTFFVIFVCNILGVLTTPNWNIDEYLQFGSGHLAQSSILDNFFYRPSESSETSTPAHFLKHIWDLWSSGSIPKDRYRLEVSCLASIPENFDFGTRIGNFFWVSLKKTKNRAAPRRNNVKYMQILYFATRPTATPKCKTNEKMQTGPKNAGTGAGTRAPTAFVDPVCIFVCICVACWGCYRKVQNLHLFCICVAF